MADRAPGRKDRTLARRAATVGLGAPVLVAALWYGGAALFAAVSLLALIGASEYARLARAAGYRPSALSDLVLVAGTLVFLLLAGLDRWDEAGAAAAALVAAAAAVSLTPAHRPAALGHAAVTVLGGLYVGVLFAHVLLLRGALGPAVALAVVAFVWTNDTAAYFAGNAWGRRRLAPSISPGKSVEGFIAGLVAAVAVAGLLARLAGWPAGPLALIGLGVALAAVAGDLWESALKRAAGVKDSGALLPGHGGVLDRFDAVLFGVPAGYYLWRWLL